MTAIIFTCLAPIACIAIFTVYVIASLLWQTFSRSEALKTDKRITYCGIASNCFFAISVCFAAFLIIAPLGLWGVNTLNKLQLLLIIGAILASSRLNAKTPSMDYLSFCVFSLLAAISLILSSDLITLFFTLELINMLIMYSFFFNANYTGLANPSSAMKISASCIYQFILNFFSSILLFVAISGFIAITGGSSFINIALWQLDSTVRLFVSLILFATLLKLGTGPWIFFKVTVYKNMGFLTVFLYTTVYLLIVLTFFGNLILVHNLMPTLYSKYLLIVVPALAIIGFSTIAFQSTNFFVFMSFSSLINITVFVLQICVATFVFK